MKSRALNLAALALLVSLGLWTGGGPRPAAAQALDAGKPPAQIFSGTCSACHRSPRGLVRNVSAGSLPGFLRQHYTTGNDMAGVMAAYVLGNGGTERVAEPTPQPKREPKQKAKSDGQDVAAHTPDAREQSKAARQKAGKKGQVEPAAKDTLAAKDVPAAREAEKSEPAKQEAASSEPPKADAAAVECKVEPPKPTVAATDETKPPRQPTSLLTLPGFPAPEPEPEAEPEPAAAAATPAPDCEPKVATTTAASVTPPSEPAPTELPKEEEPQPAPAPAPAAVAEAPKIEPLRSAVTDTTAAMPSVNIMQEEVHAPRPSRTGAQKKRAQ
jgi:hypothetical protein